MTLQNVDYIYTFLKKKVWILSLHKVRLVCLLVKILVFFVDVSLSNILKHESITYNRLIERECLVFTT